MPALEADRQLPEPSGKNGVSPAGRRRTGFASALGVLRGSVRQADLTVPGVSWGLYPILSFVSYGPLPARVPHTLLDSWHTSSPRRVRILGVQRGEVRSQVIQSLAN